MEPATDNDKAPAGDQSKDARAGDIRAVTRAISVLAAFEDVEDLSLADLAERTRLPKPTVFRLALTLENSGLLSRSAEGHLFSLGPRLVSIARLVLDRGLSATARPLMEALHRRFGHTVNLSVLDGSEMLFLDVIESRASLRMVAGIGAREPMHATAAGKAVAAELEADEFDALLGHRSLHALTPHTITSRTQLQAQLHEIRDRGYSTDLGEFRVGAHCVASAIVGRHGVIGGISLSATVDQLPEKDFPMVGGAVREATDAISAALGGRRDKNFPTKPVY
jgi:IclR family acetate operon transcriptional repressor